ncbi:MAG: HAMP domain-containing protein [Patescibacteria group bacterium]
MPDTHEHHAPYRKTIFWWVFFTFLFIGFIASGTLYLIRTKYIFSETQKELQQIAINVVQGVPAVVHESLQKPEDQKESGYAQIESYFQSVMKGNPAIDDIYTLRPTANAHTMTFVVSGKGSTDADGNGTIDNDEVKAMLGEEYDTTELPELEAGLLAPSVDPAFTYDKWGTWLSGYAPLKNAEGTSIAVLGIDLSASTVNEQRWQVLRSIGYADLIIFPIVLIISLLLAWRISKPFTILAQGMDRVTHGDLNFHLPVTGNREEKHFRELFNGMLSAFETARAKPPKKNS